MIILNITLTKSVYSVNESSNEEVSKDSIKSYFDSVRAEYNMDSEADIMRYIDHMLQTA